MAIPNIVGTATGGISGNGSFSVTPPAGAVSYLAIVEHKSGTITPPTGWTLIGSSTGQATWSLQKIYQAGASPGSSWTATVGATPSGVSVSMIGFDGALTVEQQSSAGGTSAPSVTTTNPALVVRMFGTQPFSGAPTIGYPAGSTLGRVSFAQNSSGEYWASAIACANQSTPGATGTAAFTVTGSGGHDGPYGWTLAVTSSGGGPTNYDADTATSVTATATAAATKDTAGGTSTSATAAATAAATRGTSGSVTALGASATTTAAGTRGVSAATSLSVTASLSADATVGSSNTADAPLVVNVALSGSVLQNQPSTGQRAVTATITAAARVGYTGAASLAVTAATTAAAVVTSGETAAAPLNVTASFVATAARAAEAGAGLNVSVDITATAQVSVAHTASAPLAVTASFVSGVYEPVFIFEPPTTRPQGTFDPFWGRYQTEYALSVIWNGTQFEDIAFPMLEELAPLEDGVTYFLGGHIYNVSEEVADLLIASGYSVTEG